MGWLLHPFLMGFSIDHAMNNGWPGRTLIERCRLEPMTHRPGIDRYMPPVFCTTMSIFCFVTDALVPRLLAIKRITAPVAVPNVAPLK